MMTKDHLGKVSFSAEKGIRVDKTFIRTVEKLLRKHMRGEVGDRAAICAAYQEDVVKMAMQNAEGFKNVLAFQRGEGGAYATFISEWVVDRLLISITTHASRYPELRRTTIAIWSCDPGVMERIEQYRKMYFKHDSSLGKEVQQ